MFKYSWAQMVNSHFGQKGREWVYLKPLTRTLSLAYRGFMAEFKYNIGQHVKHPNYGIGEIRVRITVKGKILLKDTYHVEFPGGTFTVKQKTLTIATPLEWKNRFIGTPAPVVAAKTR